MMGVVLLAAAADNDAGAANSVRAARAAAPALGVTRHEALRRRGNDPPALLSSKGHCGCACSLLIILRCDQWPLMARGVGCCAAEGRQKEPTVLLCCCLLLPLSLIVAPLHTMASPGRAAAEITGVQQVVYVDWKTLAPLEGRTAR